MSTRDRARRLTSLALCLAAGLGALGAHAYMADAADARIAAADRAYDEARAGLQGAQREAAERDSRASTEAEGLDADRVSADRALIADVVTRTLTWSSGEEYEAARQAATDAGVPADSQYLTEFMPPLTEVIDQNNPDDTTNRIDQLGLNSSADGADVWPFSADGGSYTYACDVMASTTAGKGAVPVETRYIVTAVTDGTGHISSMTAVAAGTETRVGT